MQNKVISLLFILLLSVTVFSLSPDEAITFVSNTNNYLLDGESGAILAPRVMITSSKEDYWIVAALKDDTPNVYIPVSNSSGSIADGELTIRNLIETEIVVTKITLLKNSSYGLSWPFSYTTRGTFDGLASDLKNMSPKVILVQTRMDEIGTSEATKLKNLADQTESLISSLALQSTKIAEETDKARLVEEKYLAAPDTNQTAKYKKSFDDYFSLIDNYKEDYTTIETNLNELKQGIAILQTDELTQTDKDGLINYLKLPTTTGKLPSFFSQTNQIKTAIDSVFSSSKNIEGLVLNLATRKVRNTTWQMIYGANSKITKANKSFYSLSEASEAIISSDNVDYWEDQESVEALKINWAQTKTRYNNQEYEKAQEFAKKAENYAIAVLEKGVKVTDDSAGQDLLIQVIGLLMGAVIILFIYEKFVVNRKKEEGEEQYEEPVQ